MKKVCLFFARIVLCSDFKKFFFLFFVCHFQLLQCNIFLFGRHSVFLIQLQHKELVRTVVADIVPFAGLSCKSSLLYHASVAPWDSTKFAAIFFQSYVRKKIAYQTFLTFLVISLEHSGQVGVSISNFSFTGSFRENIGSDNENGSSVAIFLGCALMWLNIPRSPSCVNMSSS